MMNEVLKAINERRTVRDFKPDQIGDENLAAILEAGSKAPSAWNRQPWYFTAVQKKSLLDRIVDAAREVIQKVFPEQSETMPWMVAPSFHYFYNAPTVVFISGLSGNEDAPGDCAMALMNMIYAAHSLGIQTCAITTGLAAFTTDAAPEFLADLGIPDGYKPLYALALGHTSKPIPTAAPRKEDYANYIR